ncbi:Glucan 1,3-beta-glucosidase [Fulvia fulva]|nr:Glucan 1,3-beta-glucosidase [Fulvia fulva]WPV13768.1 Glucan 1,3-beta-glucosidase [Fulvia fulva]WPV29104.1 Glucan 1,3-beta-glucosidase [Fulvia fulva]
MLFKGAVVALCAAFATAAPSHDKRGPSGFPWGKDKVRGVNIGGWLLLEPWITPSIFQQFDQSRGIMDEYTLGQALGAQQAREQVLQKHWDTWCTWADFKKIADSGFNAVRIPFGYWAFDSSDSPFPSGSAPYLDAAIDWARSTGLKVMLDLHGAPGSQNCFDNSGQKCDTPKWTTGNTVAKTLRVLKTVQDKYGASSYDDVIMGIQLLNEPLTPVLDLNVVKQFTRDGYGQQRDSSQSRVVVFHDGFQQVNKYNGFLTPSDNNAQNVVVDHHEYQVFSPELVAMKPWEHRQYICNNAFVYSGGDKWTFVGEWSGAMTDCAAALNGYGTGARYDGTFPGSSYVGSCQNINFMETWDQQFRDDTRGYIEGQMESFERNTEGWFFWNFKTEGAPEWDAFRLIDAGIFPQPLTDRKFGAICS